MTYKVTQKTAELYYSSIEKDFNVKFICIKDSFIYKMIMKKIANKIGIGKNIIDNFLSSVAMTVPMPVTGKTIIILPYPKDCSHINAIDKICTATHELQHCIDAKEIHGGVKDMYKNYISSSSFRAIEEGRGYSSDAEAMYILTGNEMFFSEKRMKEFYLLKDKDLELFNRSVNITLDNIASCPSMKASLYLRNFLQKQ
jgi:hypothetical protein